MVDTCAGLDAITHQWCQVTSGISMGSAANADAGTTRSV
jgi:hypothetical protein